MRAVPGHHAVARDPLVAHPELGAPVRHELVQLGERSGVQQKLQPLARGELARLVLLRDALGAAAELGLALEGVQPGAERVWVGRGSHGGSGFTTCARMLRPSSEPRRPAGPDARQTPSR